MDMPIKDALKFLERMKDDKEFRKRIMNSYKKAVQKSIKDEGYKFTEVELREARMRMRQEEINLGIILASQTGCHRCGCG
jgi:predicted ribosomally synthesized peptide with nif11-like leader